MVDLVYCLTNLLFFGIPLLYYYITLRSSVTLSFSSGDIDLSTGIFLFCPFVTVSEWSCCKVFETFELY